jgi:hypothetical protein
MKNSLLPYLGFHSVLLLPAELDFCSCSCHNSAERKGHRRFSTVAEPTFSLRQLRTCGSIGRRPRTKYTHKQRMPGSHCREIYHCLEDECDITCAISASFTARPQLQNFSNAFQYPHGVMNDCSRSNSAHIPQVSRRHVTFCQARRQRIGRPKARPRDWVTTSDAQAL